MICRLLQILFPLLFHIAEVSGKIFFQHLVNWNTVCVATQYLLWRNIWFANNHVEVLNKHQSLLVGCYVPTKVIDVRNKDKPWFHKQCRHAFGLKQEAHLRWTRDHSRVKWEECVHCQVRDNETYSEAKCQFNDRNRAVLMNVQSPHKWWSTLKSAVFARFRHCLCLLLRRWYTAQWEAQSPDCYLSNFRVTRPEHGTLQFCIEWTIADSAATVCIEIGCLCVEQQNDLLQKTSSFVLQRCWYWRKYYKKKRNKN